jgi:hypothetical protein
MSFIERLDKQHEGFVIRLLFGLIIEPNQRRSGQMHIRILKTIHSQLWAIRLKVGPRTLPFLYIYIYIVPCPCQQIQFAWTDHFVFGSPHSGNVTKPMIIYDKTKMVRWRKFNNGTRSLFICKLTATTHKKCWSTLRNVGTHKHHWNRNRTRASWPGKTQNPGAHLNRLGTMRQVWTSNLLRSPNTGARRRNSQETKKTETKN